MEMEKLANLRFRQPGFTIVEVMIALSLGIIMGIGALSLLLGSKRSFHELEDLSRLQENARFAMHFLTKDIRMAGYLGCLQNKLSINNHLSDKHASEGGFFDLTRFIDGDDYNKKDLVDNDDRAIDGSDVIFIRHFANAVITAGGTKYDNGIEAGSGTAEVNGVPTWTRTVTVDRKTDLAVGDIVALSDCESADVFQISGVKNQGQDLEYKASDVADTIFPGNNNNISLSTYYNKETGARLRRLVAVRYFIGFDIDGDGVPDTKQEVAKAAAQDYTPSLYRQSSNGTGFQYDELVRGVENMQFLYGARQRSSGRSPVYGDILEGGSFLYLSDSESRGGFDQRHYINYIDGVQIGLLLRSEEESGDYDVDTKHYPIFHNPYITRPMEASAYDASKVEGWGDGYSLVDPEDLRVRRRVFNTFVKVRNANFW